MKAVIQKWGNSLAIRIPKVFAEETGLMDNSQVELQVVDGQIVIRSISPKAYDLDALLNQVSDDNLHGEIDMGFSAGDEVW